MQAALQPVAIPAPSRTRNIGAWVLQVIAAVILLQTLFFKFTGAPESIYIFSKLGVEPWGRYFAGTSELIAAILLLIPRSSIIGAAMAIGIMLGAIARPGVRRIDPVQIAALIAAAIVALPLGILMGAYKPIEALLEPFVSFARYLPASAFIPLLILWACCSTCAATVTTTEGRSERPARGGWSQMACTCSTATCRRKHPCIFTAPVPRMRRRFMLPDSCRSRALKRGS